MNILDEVNKLPKKDILSEHKESILIMRDKGYTWREISDFFNERGSDGGTYHVTINSHTETYSSNGRGHIPELDGLYVPTKVNPISWNDYKDELLSDGKDVFLSRFN